MINIHTHHTPLDSDELYVLNRYPGDELCPNGKLRTDDGSRRLVGVSVGLHPWHVGTDWAEKCAVVAQKARQTSVCMLGECGLDKACTSDYEVQKEAFEAQLQVAESVGKPVLIHCVRAFDDLLRMRNKYNKVMWVVHGFRGKPQLIKQLYAKGIYVSFGIQYNVESLRLVYYGSLLPNGSGNHSLLLLSDSGNSDCDLILNPFYLETDDRPEVSLQMVCRQVCQDLGVGLHEVQSRVCLHEARLFGRHA